MLINLTNRADKLLLLPSYTELTFQRFRNFSPKLKSFKPSNQKAQQKLARWTWIQYVTFIDTKKEDSGY